MPHLCTMTFDFENYIYLFMNVVYVFNYNMKRKEILHSHPLKKGSIINCL